MTLTRRLSAPLQDSLKCQMGSDIIHWLASCRTLPLPSQLSPSRRYYGSLNVPRKTNFRKHIRKRITHARSVREISIRLRTALSCFVMAYWFSEIQHQSLINRRRFAGAARWSGYPPTSPNKKQFCDASSAILVLLSDGKTLVESCSS